MIDVSLEKVYLDFIVGMSITWIFCGCSTEKSMFENDSWK